MTGRPTIVRPPLLQWIASAGFAWGAVTLLLPVYRDPDPAAVARLGVGLTAMVLTAALFLTRSTWLRITARHPLRGAAQVGFFAAVLLEAADLAAFRLAGAPRDAVQPSSLVDFGLVFACYGIVICSFLRAYHRRRFSPGTVLLLGGLYGTFVRGVAVPAALFLAGDGRFLAPSHWLGLATTEFWRMILLWSPILLPATWSIDRLPPASARFATPWADAVRPLLWTFPYAGAVAAIYLVPGWLGLSGP